MLCCCAASQPAQRACSAPDRLGLLLSCRRRRRCERMLEYSKPAAERVHLLRRIATELDPKVERPLHRALPGGYAPPCRWLYPLPPSSRRWSCRCTASSSSNCSTTSTPRRATPQSPPSPHRHRTLPHTHTLLHARPSSTLATPPRSPLLHTRHAPTPPHPPPSTLAPAPPPHSAAPPPPPHFAPPPPPPHLTSPRCASSPSRRSTRSRRASSAGASPSHTHVTSRHVTSTSLARAALARRRRRISRGHCTGSVCER